jgi:hypothetical protein
MDFLPFRLIYNNVENLVSEFIPYLLKMHLWYAAYFDEYCDLRSLKRKTPPQGPGGKPKTQNV